ncbi:MAG: LacI family transcriptional regulator [Armatimonadetes bacterium]|nr:LacI family transcriptional regulator [Armatimonadota bacterium]
MNPTTETVESKGAATIEDIAQLLGVSRTTVSKAFTGYGRMSEKTREAVLKTAGELGYQPNVHAQRLTNGHCRNTIGIFTTGLDYGVGVRKLHAIQNLLAAHQYDVPVYACPDGETMALADQTALLRSLCVQRPQAIICTTSLIQRDSVRELVQYQNNGGIVVSYDHSPQMDCDHVFFDRVENTYRATRHLLELGHRKIGFYNVHVLDPVRVEGFRRALAEYHLDIREDWLFYGGRDEEGGVILARQFLQLPPHNRPTAMCIVNDMAAVTFIAELERAGLQIPQELSVVGHDDLPLAQYFTLPLTTASHPVSAIAENLVALLRSRLDGSYHGPARKITVFGDLVVRRSAIARE